MNIKKVVMKMKIKKALAYILLIFWTLFNIFPIYFMFTFSLKSNEEIFGANVIGLPKEWLWSNFTTALHTGNMALYFFNSILVTVTAIFISIFAAMMDVAMKPILMSICSKKTEYPTLTSDLKASILGFILFLIM